MSWSERNQRLAARLQERFAAVLEQCSVALDEVNVQISREHVLDVCQALRDEPELAFDQLMDLCGVDYLTYGEEKGRSPRFAVVYHLLSVKNNHRLRLKVFLDHEAPRVDSVVGVWNAANWFEREAFDLFGILFDNHPDLRRILTDYGFIGHPFRKDFPLIGHVEMRYDPEKRRVVYEPVATEVRELVPRVIRHDSRYEGEVPELSEVRRG
ncbi:MAG TPA: NADH-quinone oxidoreductase subunit C [Gammaproteobacteria bacterium]|nr:NADH-quinone oxidoreductase subunit C [Gammaproteobacteria bacterium]